MEAIKLIDGVQIVDMFGGISSTLEEGDANRFELNAMPQEKMSALGTKMYVTVEFGEKIEVGDGVTVQFQYDKYPYLQKLGVDKNMTKSKETFALDLPYKSQKIKSKGKHSITIIVGNKDVEDGDLTIEDAIATVVVPYIIV